MSESESETGSEPNLDDAFCLRERARFWLMRKKEVEYYLEEKAGEERERETMRKAWSVCFCIEM